MIMGRRSVEIYRTTMSIELMLHSVLATGWDLIFWTSLPGVDFSISEHNL